MGFIGKQHFAWPRIGRNLAWPLGGGEDSNAKAYLDGLTYEPTADERTAYNNLVVNAKANGYWDYIVNWGIRYTPDEEMCLKSLKGNFTGSFVGGTPPSWSDRAGMTSAASGHFDSGFAPASLTGAEAALYGGVGVGNFTMVYLMAITPSAIMHIMGLDQTAEGTALHYIFNDVAGDRIGFTNHNSVTQYKTSDQMQNGAWYSVGLNDNAGSPLTKGYENAVEIASGSPSSFNIETGNVFELASNRNAAGFLRLNGTIGCTIYGGWALQSYLADIIADFNTFMTEL
jgi:hypothetical protein